MGSPHDIRIGTAGWAIRREHAALFGTEGSHLARYAGRLNAVEINSSFYRPHRPATYARWAAETPEDFRFAVKMPRRITHELRLKETEEALARFLGECTALGAKLGPVLIQLPPALKFEAAMRGFFALLRAQFGGLLALEPRHASWFAPAADELLQAFGIARVATDPVPAKMQGVSAAAQPSGDDGLVYYRLHGSPEIYYSDYPANYLNALAATLKTHRAAGRQVWCIFDNTARGHAAENALALAERVQA